MNLRRRLRRRIRPWALAVGAAIAVAVASVPGGAVETPGSRNFTAPRSVPNYFSNESGPFQGGAGARPAQPGPVPAFAAPAPRNGGGGYAASSRRYAGRHAWRAATARGRLRVARGRAGAHRQVVHAVARSGGRASAAKALHATAVAARGKAAPTHGRSAAAGGSRVAHAGR